MSDHDEGTEHDEDEEQIRIFVAGDRASVGKSTVCLGLLGVLLQKYNASSLAYIKPATQSEKKTLVAAFCEKHGISCQAVGPIVYYRGFTRAFLAGELGLTSNDLLQQAAAAVNEIGRGKKIVVLDGVGYPAVGSICGTDNAAMAAACGVVVGGQRVPAPVLLVGKSGVGDAIDSYNLNASYLEARSVPVLGGVFNKLAVDGYYSLEKCRVAVTSYFEQYKPHQRAFGFLPVVDTLNPPNQADTDPEKDPLMELLNSDAVDDFIALFGKHVNVFGIVDAARESLRRERKTEPPPPLAEQNTTKSNSNNNKIVLTREQIEATAMAEGAAAAPSA